MDRGHPSQVLLLQTITADFLQHESSLHDLLDHWAQQLFQTGLRVLVRVFPHNPEKQDVIGMSQSSAITLQFFEDAIQMKTYQGTG